MSEKPGKNWWEQGWPDANRPGEDPASPAADPWNLGAAPGSASTPGYDDPWSQAWPGEGSGASAAGTTSAAPSSSPFEVPAGWPDDAITSTSPSTPVVPSTPGTDGLGERLAGAHGFSLDALPVNRQGRLTPEQASVLRAQSSSTRRNSRNWLLIGIGLLAAGALAFVIAGAASWIPWGLAVIGLLMIRYALRGGSAGGRASDLAASRVEVLEGVVTRRYQAPASSGSGATASGYAYEIAGKRFPVSEAAYEALDEGRRYRLYYVRRRPGGDVLANIEPIDTVMAPPASVWNAPASSRFMSETGASVADQELFSRLVGRWRMSGMEFGPLHRQLRGAMAAAEYEFRADGTVAMSGGAGHQVSRVEPYAAVDATHIRVGSDTTYDMEVRVDGDRMSVKIGTMELDFERVR